VVGIPGRGAPSWMLCAAEPWSPEGPALPPPAMPGTKATMARSFDSERCLLAGQHACTSITRTCVSAFDSRRLPGQCCGQLVPSVAHHSCYHQRPSNSFQHKAVMAIAVAPWHSPPPPPILVMHCRDRESCILLAPADVNSLISHCPCHVVAKALSIQHCGQSHPIWLLPCVPLLRQTCVLTPPAKIHLLTAVDPPPDKLLAISTRALRCCRSNTPRACTHISKCVSYAVLDSPRSILHLGVLCGWFSKSAECAHLPESL
jgi:hypothetical protein